MSDSYVPRYDRDHLPPGEWAGYRWKHDKVFASLMVPVSGPFIAVCRSEQCEYPAGWQGFIAIDSQGCPAPIPAEMHARTYERTIDRKTIYKPRFRLAPSAPAGLLLAALCNLTAMVGALFSPPIAPAIVAASASNAVIFTATAYLIAGREGGGNDGAKGLNALRHHKAMTTATEGGARNAAGVRTGEDTPAAPTAEHNEKPGSAQQRDPGR